MTRKRPDWGSHFVLRKAGLNTYYVTLKGDDKPVSPDFTDKSNAKGWIRKHYEFLLIEKVLLK